MAFPLMVRAIRLAIEAVDPKLEQAAGTLGASRLWVFATVTLPLILPGVIAGAILGFAKSMGEFGATITFVSNIPGQTQTLPSAIYAFLQVPGGDGQAFRLVLISVAVAMGALLLSEWRGAGRGAKDFGRMTPGGAAAARVSRLRAGRGLCGAAGGDGAVRALGVGQDDGRERGGGAAAARRRAGSWWTGACCWIRRRGIRVPVHRRRIGYVFQEARLFPHLTVRQNLLYGRWLRRRVGRAGAGPGAWRCWASGRCWTGGRGRCRAARRQRVAHRAGAAGGPADCC